MAIIWNIIQCKENASVMLPAFHLYRLWCVETVTDTQGAESIRALSLWDICGRNWNPQLSRLISELLRPWYYADITTERLKQTYELKENIDNINGVSILVICGARTDGNLTLICPPTKWKCNIKYENWNMQYKMFTHSDRKILFIEIQRLSQGTSVTRLCHVLELFHRPFKTTSLSNE